MAKKILLADDSLTIQKVVELTFSDSGYDLICVSNGQRALERIQQDRPDLVLADVVMPEKNGYEVCEAIKSNPATARIPVLLLSGTFEPFDRERAERIGADAIVSKPFDSQQLIAQVDTLLDRGPSETDVVAESVKTAPMPAISAETSAESDEAPFDVGFSAEDFTAAVRMPPRGLDPFEEEYVRGDVDSAIEAFERPPRPAAPEEPELAVPSEEPVSAGDAEHGREAPPPWLREESEKAPEAEPVAPSPEPSLEEAFSGEPRQNSESTVAIQMPSPEPLPREEAPSPETQSLAAVEPAPVPESSFAPASLAKGSPEQDVFELPADVPETPRVPPVSASVSEMPRGEEISREIEVLAQKSSIPELTQMLSNVSKSGGNDWSDDQIEKLARRVVEKLSDRVVREIAWEVIPDMAEIVIKRRIKELEAGTE